MSWRVGSDKIKPRILKEIERKKVEVESKSWTDFSVRYKSFDRLGGKFLDIKRKIFIYEQVCRFISFDRLGEKRGFIAVLNKLFITLLKRFNHENSSFSRFCFGFYAVCSDVKLFERDRRKFWDKVNIWLRSNYSLNFSVTFVSMRKQSQIRFAILWLILHFLGSMNVYN